MLMKMVSRNCQSINGLRSNSEPDVLIIDGMTKRFRLPGWRVAWILGPKEFVKALSSAGSYLDGGTNVPFQEAAVPMLEVSLRALHVDSTPVHTFPPLSLSCFFLSHPHFLPEDYKNKRR